MDGKEHAVERIEELEAALDEAMIIIDLQREDFNDIKLQFELAKVQIRSLMNAQMVDYRVA